MEKEKLESLLIDYIDGNLPESDRHFVEEEIRINPTVRDAYQQLRKVLGAMDESEVSEPPAEMMHGFSKLLAEEIRKNKKVVRLQPVFYKAAAAVLLVLTGTAVGFWLSQEQKRREEATALEKKKEEKHLLVFSRLENKYSPSERIQGIQAAHESVAPDDDILKALIRAMNEDPNSNVRLAALNALAKFYKEPGIRTALIASLGQQNDPVVQIALIQLLVQIREKGALEMFHQIIDKDNVLPAVKDEAYAGVFKLS